MILLGIDTTGGSMSVALADGDRLLGEIYIDAQVKHSVTLMPAVDNLLGSLAVELSCVDGFAVCAGQGSFTGIRIGVATAEALAYAQARPVYAVNTLDAIIANISGNGIVCAIMDARRGEVYAMAKRNGETVVPECAMPLDDVLDALKGCKDVVFAGDAVRVYREHIEDVLGGCSFAESNNMMQRASSACICAYKGLADKVAHDGLRARYLRVSQAERVKGKKW